MHIDFETSQMSQEEAEALLLKLYKMYHRDDRKLDDTACHELIPVLQEKGFPGLAYVLDVIIQSDEMDSRVREEVDQIWSEHLFRSPTPEERDTYEKQFRFFRNQAKTHVLAQIEEAKNLHHQAETFLNSKQLDKARHLLDQAVSVSPVPWYIWHDHGKVRYWQKDYESAIPAYHKAIEFNKDDDFVSSCDELKHCYAELAERDGHYWYEMGLEHFQHVIDTFPKRWIAWHAYGWLQLEREKPDNAFTYLTTAISLQSDDNWGWSFIDLLKYYRQKGANLDNVHEYYVSLAENGLENWGIYESIGWLEWKHKDNIRAAIAAYQKAIDLHPKRGWVWTWHSLGWTYGAIKDEGTQKYHDAFRAFEKVSELDAKIWQGWHGMGWAKEQLGGYKAAIPHYQKALELHKEYVWTWLGLARCFRKKTEPQYINSWEAYQYALPYVEGSEAARRTISKGLEEIGSKHTVDLRKILTKKFTLEEIRTLCFDLDIIFDNLGGETLAVKAISLIEYCLMRNRLLELVQLVRVERPYSIPYTESESSSTTKT